MNEHENETEAESLRHQVMDLTRAIPCGRVTSYGALGARCQPPISGYICGRVLGNVMENVPWWRVVGKAGTLPISKRGPDHALRQRQLLEDEGVVFENDAIVRRFFEDDEAEQGNLF